MNLEFRVIEMEKREPWMIAAMDHAIFEEVASGRSPATLLYHNWESGVSLSSSQPIADLNLEACKAQGFPVVRMKTGGKAVVHFPDTEFGYSLFIPMDPLQRDPTRLYGKYCGKIASVLESFGLPNVRVAKNDIFVGDKKIGGNAMHLGRVDSRAIVQQGVILYDKPDASVMLGLMAPGMYPTDAVSRLGLLLTGFTDYSSATINEIQQRLTHNLTEGNFRKGSLTPEEKARINDLKFDYTNPGEGGSLTSGLCWLPAPAYLERKRLQEEVRHRAQA